MPFRDEIRQQVDLLNDYWPMTVAIRTEVFPN